MEHLAISPEELFGQRKLLDVIVINAETNKIIALALMNHEAFKQTLRSKNVHYYDPYNDKVYLKGEHSGKIETIVEIELDVCPARRHSASLLIYVRMNEGSCLFGMEDCFFYKYKDGRFIPDENKVTDREAFNKSCGRLNKILSLEEKKEDYQKRFQKL